MGNIPIENVYWALAYVQPWPLSHHKDEHHGMGEGLGCEQGA